jgi:hypothetical protein
MYPPASSSSQPPTSISIPSQINNECTLQNLLFIESKFLSPWTWKIFLISLIGTASTYFYQMTYLFMFNKEFSYFCLPPGFEGKNFTDEEVKILTTPDDIDSCSVFDLNYAKTFKNFSNFYEVIDFGINNESLDFYLTSCFDVGGKFKFNISEGEDIAADLEIVCENLDDFSLIKAISLGMFVGSIFYGVLGDK